MSTNPSRVTVTPPSRGPTRARVPGWARAAGLAVLLAVITLLLLTPGAAACVLAGVFGR